MLTRQARGYLVRSPDGEPSAFMLDGVPGAFTFQGAPSGSREGDQLEAGESSLGWAAGGEGGMRLEGDGRREGPGGFREPGRGCGAAHVFGLVELCQPWEPPPTCRVHCALPVLPDKGTFMEHSEHSRRLPEDTCKTWSSVGVRGNPPGEILGMWEPLEWKSFSFGIHSRSQPGLLPGGAAAKSLPAVQELRFSPWIRKIPWRRKRQPTPLCLPGESYGQRSLVGYSPWGRKTDKT